MSYPRGIKDLQIQCRGDGSKQLICGLLFIYTFTLTRGGPGANFIVKWGAEKKVNQPIVEALMLETGTGVSFSSTGKIITGHAH
jgi:Protein of unknown function (DUF3124)